MIKVEVVVSVAKDVYCKDCPALFGGGESVEAAVDELQDTLRMTRDEIGKESARFYPEWLSQVTFC